MKVGGLGIAVYAASLSATKFRKNMKTRTKQLLGMYADEMVKYDQKFDIIRDIQKVREGNHLSAVCLPPKLHSLSIIPPFHIPPPCLPYLQWPRRPMLDEGQSSPSDFFRSLPPFPPTVMTAATTTTIRVWLAIHSPSGVRKEAW